MTSDTETLSHRKKLQVFRRIGSYDPIFTLFVICIGGGVALLEGIGLSFIYPIVKIARTNDLTSVSGRVMEAFVSTYQFFDIPFTLGYLIIGVALVMTFRYTMSFLVQWLSVILSKRYEKHLRTQAFDGALDAEISYYDEEGTDDILNAIITETRYSGEALEQGITLLQTVFLALIYVVVMIYVSGLMTAFAVLLLGGLTILLRFVIEPAVTFGSRVATANERVQETVQAGTQGIRDVKLFGLKEEIFSSFKSFIKQYASSEVNLKRNEIAIRNLFELSAAITIFALIYIGFTFTELEFGELGIFLIAIFQLAPQVSKLNSQVYRLEGYLSHSLRTFDVLETFEERQEQSNGRSVSEISQIVFDNVEFSYTEDEQVLRGLSFEVEKEQFIAFVGQSGAGKSTIVSLLGRMYDPDRGEIRADGVPVDEYDISEWRERIAIVRQQPFIFTDTLENNVTIGNRDATRQEVKEVCEISKVDEFVDDLPNGYDSQLGDDGVRLSGGQRQRVALARALLTDADFLVLDEATSDLDSNLEKEVQMAIESMDQNYGIIAIAHRLSTVKNADRIYTVENGEIIEAGTHKELINEDGEYAELYTIQANSS